MRASLEYVASLESQLADAQARLAGYEWIPVGERLPKLYDVVLIKLKSGDIKVSRLYPDYFDDEAAPDNCCFEDPLGVKDLIGNVECWYSIPELPEAPKEEEE